MLEVCITCESPTSGGSRVRVVGVATPFLLTSELKHEVLKPHCAHFQYLIKITKPILDEVRHLAAKLQTCDQDIFVVYGMVHSVRN